VWLIFRDLCVFAFSASVSNVLIMHWLAIHLPLLPLEIFSRGEAPQRPLAVAEERCGRQWILAGNRLATEAGVTSGMAAGAARAIASGLRILQRDRQQEQAALEGLAVWAGQFTSQVSLEPPRGLLLEVGGSLRLFGGVAPLLSQARSGLEGLGYRACFASAPTPAAAILLAVAGREENIGSRQQLRSTLATLSLSELPLTKEQRAALRGMGLKRLGELLRLPRHGLTRRLGKEIMLYLERLLGSMPEPRPIFEPPAGFYRRLELPAEVESREALLFAAKRLLLELGGFLTARQGGAQTLLWQLLHGGEAVTRFRLGLLAAERDPLRLLELLQERLERIDLPAPVRELVLEVRDVQPLAGRPLALFGAPAEEGDGRLLERLRARLGERAVSGIRLMADYRPERAWAHCGPGEAGEGCPSVAGRPLWLLSEPLPLQERDGWPYHGGRLQLEPERERIESGWWDGAAVARDYFVARTAEGERLWVYRELYGRRRWFLHGFFV
jgi:protein ImuB